MNRFSVTFAALAVRDFRRQWIASTLATTAFMTTFVLVPIVAYQLTGSYAASGFAAMGNGVGMLFLTPLGGVVADRFPKKPIVLIGQYSTLLVIAGTGALIATDLITVPLLFVSTLLSGATFALTGPARQSWVAELVPPRLVPNAVALQQMGINIAQVLGPTLASIAVVAFSVNAGNVYLGISLVFLVVVPLNHMLPRTMPKVVQRRSPRRELADGFHYLRRNPRLRILWVFWLVVVICGFAIQTLMPGILDQEFSRSSDEAVLINAIFGISALAINLPLAGLVGGRFAWPLLLGTSVLMAVGFVDGGLGADVRAGFDPERGRRGGTLGCDAGQPVDHDVQHSPGVLRSDHVVRADGVRAAVDHCSGLGRDRGRGRRSRDARVGRAGGDRRDGVDAAGLVEHASDAV